MARRYGVGSAPRPSHRAPFQMLEITGTAQHRRVSLLSSQEPLAEQESRIAPARSDVYRQWHQRDPHRKSWGWKDFLIQDRGLARLSIESARPVYHRYGHAQSLTRLTGRSFPRPQAQGLYRTGSP